MANQGPSQEYDEINAQTVSVESLLTFSLKELRHFILQLSPNGGKLFSLSWSTTPARQFQMFAPLPLS